MLGTQKNVRASTHATGSSALGVPAPVYHSSFDIRHSFVIRHWAFGIPAPAP
jgi:hypothetical protein